VTAAKLAAAGIRRDNGGGVTVMVTASAAMKAAKMARNQRLAAS
jgi:hypothetical protein